MSYNSKDLGLPLTINTRLLVLRDLFKNVGRTKDKDRLSAFKTFLSFFLKLDRVCLLTLPNKEDITPGYADISVRQPIKLSVKCVI